MRIHLRMFVLGFFFLATPAVATAETIDFNPLSYLSWESGETYFEDGYALYFESDPPPGWFYQGPGDGCSPTCADNGTSNMMSHHYSEIQTMTLTRVGGGTFSLLSFDGAESFSEYPNLWASAIQANTATFTLDQINDGVGGVVDFQTFAAGLMNVTSVTFSGVPNAFGYEQFKIDNLVVEATAVPDQGATAFLLILGTGGLLLVAETRRRKRGNAENSR